MQMIQNRFIFFLLIILFVIPCYSMKQEKNDTSKQVTTSVSIYTISAQCIAILAQLDAQPLRKRENSLCSSVSKKILPVNNFTTGILIELLCNATQNTLKKKERWHVGYFSYLNKIYDDYGHVIDNGIEELILDKFISTRCSLQQLKTHFDEIIEGIQTGWRSSTLAEHSNILVRFEKKYSLFVKPYLYKEEDTLIRFLITSLSLQANEVNCFNNETTDFDEPTLVMLWIKKLAFDKVIQTLGIKEIKYTE